MINAFESAVYSEELYPINEAEHDEVMRLMVDDDWQGYADLSHQLEQSPSIENFIIENGKVRHKPEPSSLGRIGGYEL